MKSKVILLFGIVFLHALVSFSQPLKNSTWTIYDNTSAFFYYFHFGTDTIFYSGNGDVWGALAKYQVNNNNYAMIDLLGKPCPNDTGKYTFSIQNDTLNFTLISDDCPTRPNTFASYHWVRILTGIQELSSASPVKMFPNPTSGLLTIPIDGEKNIVISNSVGLTIKTIKTDNRTISFDDLPTGVYMVTVFNDKNKLLAKERIVYGR